MEQDGENIIISQDDLFTLYDIGKAFLYKVYNL